MYRTGADFQYSKPLCDRCQTTVEPGATPAVLVFTIERAEQISEQEAYQSPPSEHHGHLCPECHNLDRLPIASGMEVTYHFAGDTLVMLEVASRKESTKFKATPQDAPTELLDPILSVQGRLPFPLSDSIADE